MLSWIKKLSIGNNVEIKSYHPIVKHICPYDKGECNTLMCEEGPTSCEFKKLELQKTGTAISKVPYINHNDSIGE